MKDLSTLMEKIHREAEEARTEVRFVRTCKPGDEIRQGDVYLYPIDAPSEHGAELESRQLAPGTTPGSRHIVDGEAVLFERTETTDPLDGPLFHARERLTVTHPEHAHISLPAGWYEARFQRDFSTAGEQDRIQRVVD